ncbi:HEAT repeat domain-containing protein [Humisphaera borealis]|uniref:HEAT repeat domain-containing protein n=1 Tax=Humisphaera borealis TaxID=2807512 RepID=A0A7M2WST1_9BACT|nr:HEAT repeat domain-containing protein [Humisphaera borealis]QOV88479.1 HEAT repeat domain-containing protein [Humisphaera borealis]
MTLQLSQSRTTLLTLSLIWAVMPGCSSSSERLIDPATEIGTSERQREWGRTLAQPLGFLEAPFVKSGHIFEDVSDAISSAPTRYALMMEDPASPDARRTGLSEMVERPFGGKPPYTTRYAQIAVEQDATGKKSDYLLRASAIRGLNRSREPGHTPLFIKALSDENDWVRLEAVKALNRLPDESAIPALLAVLTKPDENKDIRIAAAEALQHYKKLDVARVLVGLLGDREFGLAWQSHKSLTRLTGKDLGYDDKAWLSYLTGAEKPLG